MTIAMKVRIGLLEMTPTTPNPAFGNHRMCLYVLGWWILQVGKNGLYEVGSVLVEVMS